MTDPHNPLDVGARKKMTPKKRMQVFVAHGGKCCLCDQRILVGDRWILEHIKPLWRDGDNDDANLAPAHEKCAKHKTKAEASQRSKVRSIGLKHMGAGKSRKGPPMAGSRDSKWKRRMDGTVVRRDK